MQHITSFDQLAERVADWWMEVIRQSADVRHIAISTEQLSTFRSTLAADVRRDIANLDSPNAKQLYWKMDYTPDPAIAHALADAHITADPTILIPNKTGCAISARPETQKEFAVHWEIHGEIDRRNTHGLHTEWLLIAEYIQRWRISNE